MLRERGVVVRDLGLAYTNSVIIWKKLFSFISTDVKRLIH